MGVEPHWRRPSAFEAQVKHGLWRLFGFVEQEEAQLASVFAQCEDAARKLVAVQVP